MGFIGIYPTFTHSIPIVALFGSHFHIFFFGGHKISPLAWIKMNFMFFFMGKHGNIMGFDGI